MRVKLRLADLDVIFADRDKALRQFEDKAVRGTYSVHVIYGPSGCGKTASFGRLRRFSNGSIIPLYTLALLRRRLCEG